MGRGMAEKPPQRRRGETGWESVGGLRRSEGKESKNRPMCSSVFER